MIEESKLLATNTKNNILHERKGIRYLLGKRYLMTGNSVPVEIPKYANYVKIYAEIHDVRVGINKQATPDSPMIAFGGMVTEMIDEIENLNTMALYSALDPKGNHYCNVVFFRRNM